jgi:type IV pilus assembly protein PilE
LRTAGFTLIEIMIVVVLVAVLLGIALPAYQGSMQKAHRTDARAILVQVANRQEQYMLDRSSYAVNLTSLNYPDPILSEEGHYTVERVTVAGVCAADDNACYALQATPVSTSPQAKDTRCTSFTLTSTGVKTAQGTVGNECW